MKPSCEEVKEKVKELEKEAAISKQLTTIG
jgi:hypothetical protein